MENKEPSVTNIILDKNPEKEKQMMQDLETVKKYEQIRARLAEIEEKGMNINAEENAEYSLIKSELSQAEDDDSPVDYQWLFYKYEKELPTIKLSKDGRMDINQLMRFPSDEFILNEISFSARNDDFERYDEFSLLSKEKTKEILEAEKSKLEKKLNEIEKLLV